MLTLGNIYDQVVSITIKPAEQFGWMLISCDMQISLRSLFSSSNRPDITVMVEWA